MMDRETVAEVVCARGLAMSSQNSDTAMIAVIGEGASNLTVNARAGEQVWLANVNSPSQVCDAVMTNPNVNTAANAMCSVSSVWYVSSFFFHDRWSWLAARQTSNATPRRTSRSSSVKCR